MKLLLRAPVWLIILIRLAFAENSPHNHTLHIEDPIKDLQDELMEVNRLLIMVRTGWISNIVFKSLIAYRDGLTAEIVMLRNLNVAAVGFIPKDKGETK